MSNPTQEEHHHRHMFHDEMDAQHRRDMEQLAKFGYKQELRRSLGFFSTFAIAFSFISATNGFYSIWYYGLATGGPAALIWSWPIVVFGQLMVCLVFAEAASHYPLAGGIYQWAKRFMGGTWGWFVAWMFIFALIITVAAVAYPVAGIVCSLTGWNASNTTLLFWIAFAFTVGPMLINVFSVKITAFFNNIGTVTEIIGLVVIAIALYVAVIIGHGAHQSIGVLFNQGGTAAGHPWGYPAAFAAGMLASLWVLYGFDTAGGLAEETVNPSREVPRAMISAVLITAAISAFWLVAMDLAIPDIAKTQAQGTNAIAYVFEAHFAKWVTDLFLVSVCAAIFVCCLAIQAACTRLLFAYGRDKMVPASRLFGYVHPRTKTPLFSAFFLGAAVVAILAYVSSSGNPAMAFARIISGATALTYVSYQMVMIAGLYARSKGYPKERAYFNLGRWGWAVNIIALVYGVLMIVNLAWPRPTVGTAWYDRYNVIIVAALILAAGAIVYLIQRARGVDLSVTIHEIELAPEQAEAMAGMAGVEYGEAGAVPATEGALDMSGGQPPGPGPISIDPPSGPQAPSGPQI